MAPERTDMADDGRARLFEALRAAKADIIATTARETGIDAERLDYPFDAVLELVSDATPDDRHLEQWQREGARMAREAIPAERVMDGALTLNWAIWEVAMRQDDVDHGIVVDFADRLMRGMDEGLKAVSQGYLEVEVEIAAAHSGKRRSVLEEVLGAPRSTPEDRARIRRRGERYGLSPMEPYRLILILAPGRDDPVLARSVDALEHRIRVPGSHHRRQPGIRLPVVLDWRGRILVFTTADWTGEGRLREALPEVVGEDYVAVDSGTVSGCDALAGALSHAEYTLGVASSLGRTGWLGDPGRLALETTFLLDDELVTAAIGQELGPLLADPRMGEDLVETLEVYLGSRQNIRETARRLHLAPRTVAYRLERIETLLGRAVEGDTAVRLGAALLARRVQHQAGRLMR